MCLKPPSPEGGWVAMGEPGDIFLFPLENAGIVKLRFRRSISAKSFNIFT